MGFETDFDVSEGPTMVRVCKKPSKKTMTRVKMGISKVWSEDNKKFDGVERT